MKTSVLTTRETERERMAQGIYSGARLLTTAHTYPDVPSRDRDIYALAEGYERRHPDTLGLVVGLGDSPPTITVTVALPA